MKEVMISGLTRPEDAAAAAAAGATYLGVAFTPDLRQVQPDEAREIVLAAGSLPVFGSFAGRFQVSALLRIAAESNLRGLRLYPPCSTQVARRVQAEGYLVWRVMPLASERDLSWLAGSREGSNAVVVEMQPPLGVRDAGVLLPLCLAREARANLPGHQLVLAGGLTPDNVGEAITEVRPDIVDVSAGVEIRPGIKDPQRIMQFMEAAVGHHSAR
jgi:phosphoribosylanthranilate isomerase